MKCLLPSVLAFGLTLSGAARADNVTEALDAARAAYDAGNVETALDELSFAQGLLQAMRADSFSSFLPDAPSGWTREINTDMSGAMMMVGGGGVGAEAEYVSTKGDTPFTIRMLADSPMISMMAGLLGNPAMAMASGAEVSRLGDYKVLDQNGDLSLLVDDRILIQAEGGNPALMMSVIKTIDLDGLSEFRP